VGPMRAAVMLVLLPTLCGALRLASSQVASRHAPSQHASWQSAVLAAACSVSLLSAPREALAVPPSLNEAIVEASEASYPIINALEPLVFPSFTDTLGKLLLDIKPEKLGRSIELAIDVFDSVPEQELTMFNGVVKEAFADLKTDSCTLIPLPSQSLVTRFQTVATQTIDAEKLSAFGKAWGPSIAALSKTSEAICLPPVEALDKLALAQADVGRAFDFNAGQRFFEYTVPMLKGEVRLTDETLSLVSSAKMQAADATLKEKVAFQKAGKKLESAAKAEKEKQTVARYKAEMAAKAAAKKASS